MLDMRLPRVPSPCDCLAMFCCRRIASVPKEKTDLYAMPVDWAVLEQSSTIEKKMRPWIAKKVTEYFGETDETVISFVMEEVRAPNVEKRKRYS